MAAPSLPAPSPSARALIVVDVQNDFVEGGALAVPDGSAVVPAINQLLALGPRAWGRVVLTQDWHPAEHASFAANHPGATPFTLVDLPGVGPQMMWPAHCVQGSPGAAFHAGLRLPADALVVRKGTHTAVDSYSGFGDGTPGHALEKTELEEALRARGITHVVVCGA
jgi:nicotinamidase/pyrazinamidase